MPPSTATYVVSSVTCLTTPTWVQGQPRPADERPARLEHEARERQPVLCPDVCHPGVSSPTKLSIAGGARLDVLDAEPSEIDDLWSPVELLTAAGRKSPIQSTVARPAPASMS